MRRLPAAVSTEEGDKFRAGVPALLEVRRLCIQGAVAICALCTKTTPRPLLMGHPAFPSLPKNDPSHHGNHEHNPTTPLALALCLSALTMREICLVITSLNPGHEGEALLNRIRMQRQHDCE